MENEQNIKELLERGVEEIIDKSHLFNNLKSGKKLRIKLGIDPTSPHIHLGRAIQLFKLLDFQKLGHTIVLIVGDFTGVVGDTSDKESERPMLSGETIKKNFKTYIEQAGKIIDIKKTEIYFNSKWLSKLEYSEIGKQADMFSVGDFIARENISIRIKEGKRVSLREVLYPLMQGYDSVKVEADVEIGGTDQRFNLLAGRHMQRLYNQEPQDIIMSPLIEGLDGRKMSSSFGNTINIFDAPNEMFGKIMSLQDKLIIKYFTLLTRCPKEVINEYEEELKKGINPRDLKIKLAREIIHFFHDTNPEVFEEADKAEEYFITLFSKGGIPEDIKTFPVEHGDLFSDIIIVADVLSSKSEFKRKIDEKAVRFTEEGMKERVIEDYQEKINASGALRIGKKIIGLKVK